MITPDTIPDIGRARRRQAEQTVHFLSNNISYCRAVSTAASRHLAEQRSKIAAAYEALPDGSALVNCRGCAEWLVKYPQFRPHHFPRLEPYLRFI